MSFFYQTLLLSGGTEPPGNIILYVSWDKIAFFQRSVLT